MINEADMEFISYLQKMISVSIIRNYMELCLKKKIDPDKEENIALIYEPEIKGKALEKMKAVESLGSLPNNISKEEMDKQRESACQDILGLVEDTLTLTALLPKDEIEKIADNSLSQKDMKKLISELKSKGGKRAEDSGWEGLKEEYFMEGKNEKVVN